MSSGLAAVTRTRLQRSLGDAERQEKTARCLALVSGAIVLACTVFLLGDYTVGVVYDARQTALIQSLEAETKEDPEVAARLHEERKKQTDASLARETRGQVAAWMLLFVGSAFVASGKWWVSLQPERRPAFEELVAVRLGTVVPSAATEKKKQGEGGTESTERPRGGRPSIEEPRGEGRGDVATEATDQAHGRFARCEPEAVDLGFVDELVSRFGRGKESAIPILQAIQAHYRYLPDDALRRVCELTEITPAQIAGTSSFYSQFRRSPVGRHVVRVCHGTACHVAGAEQISEELRRHLDIPPDADTDAERRFTLDRVACVGCCSLAPVMMIGEETAGRLTPATARKALDAVEEES